MTLSTTFLYGIGGLGRWRAVGLLAGEESPLRSAVGAGDRPRQILSGAAMVRPLRVEIPGGFYHLISRGNERSPIFRDDVDRRRFLDDVAVMVWREAFRLHAYCLMDNHYHLLVQTPFGKISRAMHWLNGCHAMRFNSRHDRSGHLFEGRFKGIVIEREAHLLELTRYIVLNPVRAGSVERPEQWVWSSYRATCGYQPAPSWLDIGWTLRQFGSSVREARRAFSEFVEAGVGVEPPQDSTWQRLVGEDAAVDRAGTSVTDGNAPIEPGLADVQAVVAREWNLSVEGLRSERGTARTAGIYLARKLTRLTAQEVGRAFGVGRGRVANAIADVDRGRHRHLQPTMHALMVEIRTIAAERDKKGSQKCQMET